MNNSKMDITVKNFDIRTLLTLTTGYSFVDNFSKVFELVWFIYDDNMINMTGLGVVKDNVKKHLLNIHPELKDVKYQKSRDINEFISEQTQKFGSTLPVTKIGIKLPKKEVSMEVMSTLYNEPFVISKEEYSQSKTKDKEEIIKVPETFKENNLTDKKLTKKK